MRTRISSEPLYLTRIAIFIFVFGVVFAVFTYSTLISFTEIQSELTSFLKSLIYNEEGQIGLSIKLTLALKIINTILFLFSALFSFALFSSGLSGLFYVIAARKHGYEVIDQLHALKKIIEWQIYKYLRTFLPLFGFILVTGVLFLLGVILFNFIVTSSGIITGLTSFILGFIGFNLMFFLALAVLATIWRTANLSFGTEIALSEPDLDNKTIALRSKRIITASGKNILLLFVYIVFVTLLLIQPVSLNIVDGQAFIAFFILNSINYAGVKYLKTNAYIYSLLNYHEKTSI